MNPKLAYSDGKSIQYKQLVSDLIGNIGDNNQSAVDNQILQGLINQGIKLQKVDGTPAGHTLMGIDNMPNGVEPGQVQYANDTLQIGGVPTTFQDTPVTPTLRNTYQTFDKLASAGHPVENLGSIKPVTDYIGGIDQYSKYMTGIYKGVGNILNGAYQNYAGTNNHIINDYNQLGDQMKSYYGDNGIYHQQANNLLDKINNYANTQTALNIANQQGLKMKYSLDSNQLSDLGLKDQQAIIKNTNDLTSNALAVNQGISDKLLQYLSPIVQNKANLESANANTALTLTQQLANNYVNSLIAGSPVLKNVSSATTQVTKKATSTPPKTPPSYIPPTPKNTGGKGTPIIKV